MFKYTKAICRMIPRSIVNGGIRFEVSGTPLDYNLAVKQQQQMMGALKSLGIQVTLLETDESTPDCVFVEDPAVVIDDTVLITNPGAVARKPETSAIRNYFQQHEKHLNMIEMKAPAQLDGGDVMFTGSEIFVGLSKRTNQEGVDTIRKAFPKYPVHGISVGNQTLHLKSMMSMGGEGVMICGESPDATNAIKMIQEKATSIYSVLRTPDDFGSNVVIANGKIVCRSRAELPNCFKEFAKLAIPKIEVDSKELTKVDGCLTCCSLLYN